MFLFVVVSKEKMEEIFISESNKQPMFYIKTDSELVLIYFRNFHSRKSIMYIFMGPVMIDNIADRL